MKLTIKLLLVILTMCTSVLLHASVITITRSYSSASISKTYVQGGDGEMYTRFYHPELSASDKPGVPELPTDFFRVCIPTNCKNIRVSIEPTITLGGYKSPYRVYPVQEEGFAYNPEESTFIVPNENDYSIVRDISCEIINEGFAMGDSHMVDLKLCPFSYNDSTRKISFAGSVTVHVEYDLCGESEMSICPISSYVKTPTMYDFVDLSVINKVPDTTGDLINGKTYQNSYYIIVPSSLKNAVEEIASWKRQKGYRVVVQTIESILSNSRYRIGQMFQLDRYTTPIVDAAASLRCYLQTEFKQYGAFYCLLVGDANTSMPIRKIYSDSHYGDNVFSENAEDFIPTDNYFSDLTQIWNLQPHFNGTLYTCSNTDISYNPDIFVGRLLCSTEQQIHNYIDKLRIYEANPGLGDSEYLTKGTVFRSLKTSPSGWQPIISAWKKFLDVHYIEDSESDNYPLGKEVIESISKSGLSSWIGHGIPLGIAVHHPESGARAYITSLDSIRGINEVPWGDIPVGVIPEDGNGLDCMTNRFKPGIVYSTSCDNMIFDCMTWKNNDGSFTVFDPSRSLAEVFLTSPEIGGIAFLANTRNGIGGASSHLETLFIRDLEQNRKLGIAEASSKSKLPTFPRFPYRKYIQNTHNLGGDPEVEMWLKCPNIVDFNSVKWTGTSIPASLQGWKVIVSDGLDSYANMQDVSISATNTVLRVMKQDFVASAWKTEYLPYLHYFGQNNNLLGVNKKIYVRTASLGSSNATTQPVSDFRVGLRSYLFVKALDYISSSPLFMITPGGKVNLQCHGDINLEGFTVQNGGELNASGREIRLGSGSLIEKGATVKLNITN